MTEFDSEWGIIFLQCCHSAIFITIAGGMSPRRLRSVLRHYCACVKCDYAVSQSMSVSLCVGVYDRACAVAKFCGDSNDLHASTALSRKLSAGTERGDCDDRRLMTDWLFRSSRRFVPIGR